MSSNSLTIDLDNLTSTTAIVTSALKTAQTEQITEQVSNESRQYHPILQDFRGQVVQRNVKLEMPKPRRGRNKFSLRSWKRKYANAQTEQEREELEKQLLLSAFQDTYESHRLT